MYSATQASSSRSNASTTIAVDARQTPQTPQTPVADSRHGPIINKHNPKNTVSRHLSEEVLSDVAINIPSCHTKESRRAGEGQIIDIITSIPLAQERFPSPAGDSEAADPSSSTTALSPHPATYEDQAVLQSTWVNLVQVMREIEGFYELEARQGEEIKALSEQLFAAAWQASMSTPQEIQYRCLGRITDLLGEGVGQLASLDGKYLRREGKLPERTPSWDFGDLVPGPVLPRGTEKRRLEEAHEEVVQAESLSSGSSAAAESEMPSDACSPMKRRRLETERAFTSQEVSWVAQVFEEEDSEPQGDGGDDTDPDSDGTEPDSDGTEPDDDAEDPSAPQASTSTTPFKQPVSSSADITHSVAAQAQQKPKGLQRASTSYDLSFNGSLPVLPPTPMTPRLKPKQKVRPQHIPAPYSQAAGTWQEKGVLERCWDGWGYINGRLYLDARNEVSRDRMATEWIDRMI